MMKGMLSVEDAGEGILHVARRMYERGYVAANDGNVSIRLSPDRLLVTPTGMSKGFMKRSDLVVTDMAGEKISGKRAPTSEVRMHIRAYQLRDDIGSVVHAHPPYATAFAVAGMALAECILPEVIVSIGSVPLAQYGTPSTEEVSQSIETVVTRCDAFLLRNHGVMTVGPDVLNAYHKVETVEHFAQISFIARQLDRINPLGIEEVRKLLAVREKLGIKGPSPGCQERGACTTSGDMDEAALAKVIVEEVVKILREHGHAMD